jgi:hypothetical protein
MLHLQDSHPNDRSLEGFSAAEIATQLGGFSAELLHIELGRWTKKDSRRLAIAAGMEKLYQLVFTPSSGDVHGTWLSLERSNLVRCVEPLHRLHRLPGFFEPPALVNVLFVAQEVLESCLAVGTAVPSYPPLESPLAELPEPGRPAANERESNGSG